MALMLRRTTSASTTSLVFSQRFDALVQSTRESLRSSSGGLTSPFQGNPLSRQSRNMTFTTSSEASPLSCTTSSVDLPASLWKAGIMPNVISKGEDGVESMEATLMLNIRCNLGECILFDDDKNQLLWTDINDQHFYALSLPSEIEDQETVPGTLVKVNLPQMLGSFAMRSKGKEGFLCAFEDGFQLCRLLPPSIEPSTTPVTSTIKDWILSAPSVGEPVAPVVPSTRLKDRQSDPTVIPRLNDGRCDPTGRFLCGGYFGGDPNVYMKVFKCEGSMSESNGDASVSLKHEPIYENIQVTNSICFHDRETMYLADSPQRTIWKFPYDCEKGSLDLSAQTVLHKHSQGNPDGSCVDEEGYVWNAVWREGAGPSFVYRLHPETGDIVFRVLVPPAHGVSQLTCCCFGGPNLDILFISSAAEKRDLSREPYAGSIYAAKVPFRGKPEVRFAF